MRQVTVLSLAAALSLVLQGPIADACGVKLTVKTSGARKASARMAKANRPVRANEPREVVTARVTRTPVAAGPEPERQVVAAKPVEMQTKPAETTPEPATPKQATPEQIQTPKVAEAETKQPEPKPEPVKTTPPPKKVATATPKAETASTPAPSGKGLSQEMFFGLSSAKVRDDRKIAKAVKWMNDNPDANVVAEGHADPSGTHDGNMALSQARAESVRDALVGAGINSSRIEVVPFGDTKLRYGARDGRNRRVFLHVKTD